MANQNPTGQLSATQQAEHVLAHGLLAAAVAATGGNDVTTAALAAGGSEAAAPVLAQALYGTQDPSKLTQEQKDTLTTIANLAGTAIGATTGQGANVVASSQAAQNAVENNWLSYKEKSTQIQLKNQLAHCVGVCTQARMNELQTQIDQLNNIDKKRESDHATACAGGLNNNCSKEVEKAGLALNGYNDEAEKAGGFIDNQALSDEQDHLHSLVFDPISDNETKNLEVPLAVVDAVGGTLSGTMAFSGAKSLVKSSGVVDDVVAETKVNAVTTQIENAISNKDLLSIKVNPALDVAEDSQAFEIKGINLDNSADTVVRSDSVEAVGNATATQVKNVVTKSGVKALPAPKVRGNPNTAPNHGTITVTNDGVALVGSKHQIPSNYVQNPHRPGNYGEIVNGKFKERLRIDPATPPGQKGPNYSHYHKNGKGKHYSPREGDPDPGF